MKNKKTVITITSIVAVLLVIIGVTYAYWLVTKTQTNQNIISSGCLDISLSGEKNDIELTDQFPMSDEDGMKLTPYEFTVTNNCNTSVDYQVNLESIGDSNNAIKASAIKVALNDEIKRLRQGGNVATTLSEAYESNRILFGTLAGSSEETEEDTVTYELRIWIDANAPISEQNKTFRSKISVTIGQGIFNPYKEGTLAYDILSNYGGEEAYSSVNTYWTMENIENAPTENVSVPDATDLWFSDEYIFDVNTGMYKLSGELMKATMIECRGTEGLCKKYSLLSTDENSESYKLFEVTEYIGDFVVKAKVAKSKNEESSVISTTESGLYKTADELGDTYYFRGDIKNNYVKFGTWGNEATAVRLYALSNNTYTEFGSMLECEMRRAQYSESQDYDYECRTENYTPEEAGEDMYWRIVRINGDGSIRLIYDGTSPVENDVSHKDYIKTDGFSYYEGMGLVSASKYAVVFNNQTVSGRTKGLLDLWYEDNLKNDYAKYIADSVFCSNSSKLNSRFDGNYDNDDRLYESPIISCSNKDDRYTMNTNIGNGLLTNPVGLLSVDEFVLSSYNQTKDFISNSEFWLMTPLSNSVVYLSTGADDNYYPHNIRPVINLKADVKFRGEGTIDSPYEIVIQ
ncbi:MAG: hypothetical protein IJN03_03570 [Bacilli bacterium]|nr:hypothetical protein [Bacilli bacterium]